MTTHIGSGDAYAQSVALQMDGRILVAGRALVGGQIQASPWRVITRSATLR